MFARRALLNLLPTTMSDVKRPAVEPRESQTSQASTSSSGNEREVTDPVTHLPLNIHDQTRVQLEQIPPPLDQFAQYDQKNLQQMLAQYDQKNLQQMLAQASAGRHMAMEELIRDEIGKGWWEDPSKRKSKQRIRLALVAAAASAAGGASSLLTYTIVRRLSGSSWLGMLISIIASCISPVAAIACVLALDRKLEGQQRSQDGEHAPHAQSQPRHQENDKPETADWLNSFLGTLWPMVNPALFTSLCDMIEDSIQASVPKAIKGVRIADLQQGSVPLRMLGMRALDTKEEGDYVNLEMAVAYRARATSGSLKSKAQNLHMLMQFWLPMGIVIPVWVDVTGILATARVRLLVTPDPPFLAEMVLTLLGQPKVTVACTPLAKSFFDVMDVPGLSKLLQDAINSVAEMYVAPRSLTLDLKTLLSGREKMDTDAVGVFIVTVKRAHGFTNGDNVKFWEKKGDQKGDLYVTLAWSKWGKPLWSTRIIEDETNPVWEETTMFLVGETDINAEEKIKLALVDSDRFTADDYLGIVEVPIKDLMASEDTQNRMSRRDDVFHDAHGDELGGRLTWEVGWFAKTTFEQSIAHSGKDAAALQREVKEKAVNNIRRTRQRDGHPDPEHAEMDHQVKLALKDATEEIIAGTTPSEDFPSGILSFNIEQIIGLEIPDTRKGHPGEGAEEEESDNLPSGYCTVMLNHERIYKTRTKLKSNKPYFNAGTERFIRDWRSAQLLICVRDSRSHENDPILGVVTDIYPIVGGIGYGRMRVQLVFRTVQAQIPRPLAGWDVGTLDIDWHVRADAHFPADLTTARIILRTPYGHAKLSPRHEGGWAHRGERPVRLPVRKRYASCLLVQFRKHALGPDRTTAVSSIWLKDLVDDEEQEVELPVWKHKGDEFHKARQNAKDARRNPSASALGASSCAGYHQKLSGSDAGMKDLMEALDCAEGEREEGEELETEDESDSSSSSSSGSDVEDQAEEKVEEKADKGKATLRDVRGRQGELNRRHRG
ncbi:hypothetical protein BD626DRAFT_499201 [Schizophyllum amplum]|uniref:C2 domain-containing protein n=1 Tax=Schizophyllum amplum TaxID=97359 RepID=A0A550CCB1_9AGAR|nr:hypothetical protein BD626DRAFT_499201 [Auriculariopsis ampla]